MRLDNSLRGQVSIWYESRFSHLPNPASEDEAATQWTAITAGCSFRREIQQSGTFKFGPNLASAQMWGRKYRLESGESLTTYLDVVTTSTLHLCKSRIHMVILFRHNLLFVSLHVPPEVGRPRAVVDNVMSSYPLDLLSCIISNTPPPISALSPSVTVTVTIEVKAPEGGGCVSANGTMYWLWTKVLIRAGRG